MTQPSFFIDNHTAIMAIVLLFVFTFLAVVLYFAIREKRTPPPALTKVPASPSEYKLNQLSQVKNLPSSNFVQINGFNVRFIQLEGGKTTYVDSAHLTLAPSVHKPDLLLLHGIGESAYHWRHIIKPLSENFRVTAIDLPGFGFSDKPTDQKYGLDEQAERVFEILDQLQIRECFIAGHSMGATIAAWMAKQKPERVKKLVMMAPAASHKIVWLNPDYFWLGVQLTKNFVITKKLIRTIYTKGCVYKTPSTLDEDVEEYFRPSEKDPNAVVTFVKANHLLRDKRIPAELNDIAQPVLLMYGQNDRIVKEKHLADFLRLNPRLTYCRIAECGHQIAEEHPTLCIQ
jgi:pimeloyl-ACP methyl ester carboxylesterase